jgi:thiaminase/transcriptional activator TenA
MAFSDKLVARTGRGWERYQRHPFFDALADGSLTRDQFRFWLEQDIPYVAEYGRAREVLAHKVAADPAFAELNAVVEAGSWVDYAGELEISFEFEMLRRIGVEPERLGRFDALPAREGYLNHVARTALEGSLGELVCALLPCEWGFSEMAERLTGNRVPDLDPVYSDWIDYYTAAEQVANTELSLRILERAAEITTPEEREQMALVFQRSVSHQIAVLDAAWLTADPWPEERALAVAER